MSMIRLECTTGGHNKFYEFHGIESNGRFTVKGLYGRIGQAASESIIYDGDNKAEANKEFEKKKIEKLKKGMSSYLRTAKLLLHLKKKKA